MKIPQTQPPLAREGSECQRPGRKNGQWEGTQAQAQAKGAGRVAVVWPAVTWLGEEGAALRVGEGRWERDHAQSEKWGSIRSCALRSCTSGLTSDQKDLHGAGATMLTTRLSTLCSGQMTVFRPLRGIPGERL